MLVKEPPDHKDKSQSLCGCLLPLTRQGYLKMDSYADKLSQWPQTAAEPMAQIDGLV